MIKQAATDARDVQLTADVRENPARKNYLLVVLLALVGFAVVVWSLLTGDISFVIIFFATLTLGVLWSLQLAREDGGKYTFLVGLFVLAFAIRVAFALGMHVLLLETTGTPYLPTGPMSNPDDIKFDTGALLVADAWRSGDILDPYILPDPHARLYYYLLGTLYYLGDFVGGTSMFGIVLVHCLFGALIPIYASKLVGRLYGLPEARLAGIITALFPDFILYSSVLLRDMLIALLILFALWHLTEYLLTDRRWRRLVIVAFTVGYILPALREGVLVAMAIITPLCLVVPTLAKARFDRRQRQRIILGGVVGLLLLLILVPVLAGDWIDIAVRRLLWATPERMEIALQERADPDSLSAQMLSLPYWLKTPAQIVYTVLFPLPPWIGFFDELTRIQYLVRAVSGLVWYVLLPYWFVGLLHSIRVDRFRLFPAYGASILWVIGLGLHTGFDVRYRLMAMPLILMVTAVGWYNRRGYTWLPKLWSLVLLALVGLYSVFKLWAGGDLVFVAVGALFCLGIIGFSLSILPSADQATSVAAS